MKKLYQTFGFFILLLGLFAFKSNHVFAAPGATCTPYTGGGTTICTPTGLGVYTCSCDQSLTAGCSVGERCTGSGGTYTCTVDATCTAIPPSECAAEDVGRCGYNAPGCAVGEACVKKSVSAGNYYYVCEDSSSTCVDCRQNGCASADQNCINVTGTWTCQTASNTPRPIGTDCVNNAQCLSNYCSPGSKCSCISNGNTPPGNAGQCCSLFAGTDGKCAKNPEEDLPGGCIALNGLCSSISDLCCGAGASSTTSRFCRREGGPTEIFCRETTIDTSCAGTLTNGSTCTQDCQCQSGVCASGGQCADTSNIAPGVISVPDIGSFENIIALLYGIMLPTSLGIGMLLIIKAGYKLKMSQGNPQSVAEAVEELTHAIVGVAFVLLSIVLIRVIIKAFIGDANF